MTKELENDLRQIIRVVYCIYYGDDREKKIGQFIKLIQSFCTSKEAKRIIKVIKNEKKLMDKKLEKLQEYQKEYC